MREILFRGKRTDNGKWAYGYFCSVKGSADIFVPFTEEEEKQNEGHIFSAVGGLWYKVIPETVGQFTGIVDVYGRKIFEGDIHGMPGWVITYCADVNEGLGMNAGWYIQRNNFESWMELENCTEHCIIGNIHDNPELLRCKDGWRARK